jgi:protein phosphatase
VDPWLLSLCVVLGLFLLVWTVTQLASESIPSMDKVSSDPPGRGGASSKPNRPKVKSNLAKEAFANLPTLPSVVDDDDLEITLVTASPLTDVLSSKPPPPEKPKTPEPDPKTRDSSKVETSRVAVIYEDEAEAEEITSPVARILLSAHGQTDLGHKRPRNEDSLLVFPERSLFAIADGMGGYEGGDVASALAVEILREAFDKNVFEGKTESTTSVPRRGRDMALAIQMANHAILKAAKKSAALSKMGTTIVAASFSPKKQRVYIGHVGDSRCYRLRGRTMRQLTTDHTMRQLGMKGPGASQLFQAVGISPKITIDIIVDKPRADDLYLICSDGLSKMVKDEQITQVLSAHGELETAVHDLIDLANKQGGKDNVTAILVKVVERTPLRG